MHSKRRVDLALTAADATKCRRSGYAARRAAPSARHIGRPWSSPRSSISSSRMRYHLAPSPRVLVNALPLNEVVPDALAAARAQWSPRFEPLARPLSTVLVGGSSGPFVLTPRRGAELGRRLKRFVSAFGGSVLLSDSARTPAGVIDPGPSTTVRRSCIAGEARKSLPRFLMRIAVVTATAVMVATCSTDARSFTHRSGMRGRSIPRSGAGDRWCTACPTGSAHGACVGMSCSSIAV
jgi:hypothetical protein